MTITPETIAKLRGLMDTATGEMVVSASLEATYSLMRMSTRALFVGLIEAAPALLDAAERLAEVTAERDALSEGRCLADITHRDEEHRQSVCMLPKDHAPLEHDDCMGCTWTDAEHWEASAVDRVANALASHPDPTCDEYASKGPISCGWKRALIDVRWALADGSES